VRSVEEAELYIFSRSIPLGPSLLWVKAINTPPEFLTGVAKAMLSRLNGRECVSAQTFTLRRGSPPGLPKQGFALKRCNRAHYWKWADR
jgi:hypothetical protein